MKKPGNNHCCPEKKKKKTVIGSNMIEDVHGSDRYWATGSERIVRHQRWLTWSVTLVSDGHWGIAMWARKLLLLLRQLLFSPQTSCKAHQCNGQIQSPNRHQLTQLILILQLHIYTKCISNTTNTATNTTNSTSNTPATYTTTFTTTNTTITCNYSYNLYYWYHY